MKIALMREEEKSMDSLQFCIQKGLVPVIAAAIETFSLPVDVTALSSDIEQADVCIFMSPTAVDRLFELEQFRHSLIKYGKMKTVAVGPATSARLSDHGKACEVPVTFSSEGLIRHLSASGGVHRSIVVLRSDSGSEKLKIGLEASGMDVREHALYGIRIPRNTSALEELIRGIVGGEQVILPFSSSMMVRNFFAIAQRVATPDRIAEGMRRSFIWAIGDETAAELSRHGISDFRTARRADFGLMLQEIVDWLERESLRRNGQVRKQ